MTIYVDELKRFPCKGYLYRISDGGFWCHMTADSLEELHNMAALIGMKRSWFQDTTVPHYDLVFSRRQKALELGAIFKPAKQQARERLGL